jgi:allophanate hydrolase subunit 2
MIVVQSWGIASSVQGAGRVGLAHLGRSRGGAVDRHSLALANRLVGNPEDAGAFETSGGLVVRVEVATVAAVAGAIVDAELGWGAPVTLRAGDVVRIGALREGLRAYVALRGGVSADATALGPDPGTPLPSEIAAPRPPETTVHVWPGPRVAWFVDDAWATLTSGDYAVEVSSRVGARLTGAALARRHHEELLPEALVEGAVQVPPDGQPIVMLADHPTTGGYPVIAVVDPADLRHVAQAAPGTALRLRPARRA